FISSSISLTKFVVSFPISNSEISSIKLVSLSFLIESSPCKIPLKRSCNKSNTFAIYNILSYLILFNFFLNSTNVLLNLMIDSDFFYFWLPPKINYYERLLAHVLIQCLRNQLNLKLCNKLFLSVLNRLYLL